MVVKMCLAKHNQMALKHLPYFLDFSSPDFRLSGTKMCSGRTTVCKNQESHWQKDREMFSRNATKSFMIIGKSRSLPKGTTLKEVLCKLM
jgi:hypothetical protein